MDVRNLDNLNFRLTLDDVRPLPPHALDRLRRECQTNLRLLANCIMRPLSPKFVSLTERCHGQIISHIMEPKPDAPLEEWSPKKEWVVKAFRGAAKSTTVAALLVQLQLCDPDIRILIASGKLPLARSIMDSGCHPFASNDVLRFLFPAWGIPVSELGGDSFLSPKRDPALNLRDPTLSISSFESVKDGGHFEVGIFDDATNAVNSRTPELVEQNVQYYDDTDPLVEPGGYRLVFGTTYADDLSDLPEVIRRRGDAYKEETGEITVSYFSLPVWKLRDGLTPTESQEIVERDRRDQLTSEDVVLTWPEKITPRFLWPKYKHNPADFNKHYLLRFKATMEQESFTSEVLQRAMVPYAEGAPMPHDRFQAVWLDLAGLWSGRNSKAKSNFTCGLAVMFELSTRRMFIYDSLMEVFVTSKDAAEGIVSFYKRQLAIGPVSGCDCEDAFGARYLEGEIMRVGEMMHVPIQMNWQQGRSEPNAKNVRIARLAGAMKRGLIQINSALPNRDLILNQFERWHPDFKKRKDDGPDCAASVWDHYSEHISPGLVTNLMPSVNTYYAPEAIPIEPAQIDPHEDEKIYADIEWMASMTAPHAEAM